MLYIYLLTIALKILVKHTHKYTLLYLIIQYSLHNYNLRNKI